MHNFRELNIWKDSLKQAVYVARLCNSFPDYEKFGITSQIRRSAVSIPSNIAEGCSRNTDKDFARFLRIALGSSYELETQLLISKELEYFIDDKNIFDENNKLQRSLHKLITNIETKITNKLT
jgi:four helix bundle protein